MAQAIFRHALKFPGESESGLEPTVGTLLIDGHELAPIFYRNDLCPDRRGHSIK